MPTVNRGQRPRGRNTSTRGEILKNAQPALARDDLRKAFAGKENYGPSGSKQTDIHSTNVKSRRTKKSKERIPKD